jgi:peptidoglycan/xylan/chitin deacetylase (PgdA/CDA1 family)
MKYVLKLLAIWLLCGPIGLARAADEVPIYLYQSPLTAAFFKNNGADYSIFLQRWREYLKQYGGNFQHVNRKELLTGLKPGVLILASAILLDEAERTAIADYADHGGNVLLTWGSGVRDGKGAWRGYQFLQDLMAVKVQGKLERNQDEWFLNLFGDGPLSWPIAAGKRIYLGRTAEQPLRLSAPLLAARYLDWGRSPSANSETGAIVYGEKNGSRRVMFGFSESSWQYDQDNDLIPLLDATLAWLRHQVRIWPATWPQGFQAAHLLEMDTEDKFHSAENFAADLDAIKAKGTFYCLTSIAKNQKKLLNQLAANHEVGYHGDVHTGFKGKSAEQQEQRIVTMQKELAGALDAQFVPRVIGFRAPTESFDATTEQLLRKHGIRYQVSNPEYAEARLPFFSQSEENLDGNTALVILPRTQNDDLNYGKMKKNPEQIIAQMGREFDYVLEMGALGVLSVHSQNYATGGWFLKSGFMKKLVPPYLQRLQQHRQQIWVASGSEIAEWWRAKSRVKQTSDTPSDQLAFQVSAPGVAQNLGFLITHPDMTQKEKHNRLQIQSLRPSQPQPTIKAIDAFRSVILFEPLAAGNYAYQIRFANSK